MNLEQLIFTWKGRHLVLPPFASKFYHHYLKNRGVDALFYSWKQISNKYAPCFSRIDFVIIPSYIDFLVCS